jgi:hypothetical protein
MKRRAARFTRLGRLRRMYMLRQIPQNNSRAFGVEKITTEDSSRAGLSPARKNESVTTHLEQPRFHASSLRPSSLLLRLAFFGAAQSQAIDAPVVSFKHFYVEAAQGQMRARARHVAGFADDKTGDGRKVVVFNLHIEEALDFSDFG